MTPNIFCASPRPLQVTFVVLSLVLGQDVHLYREWPDLICMCNWAKPQAPLILHTLTYNRKDVQCEGDLVTHYNFLYI